MTNKHMKRYSTSIVIRKMFIKTTRYALEWLKERKISKNRRCQVLVKMSSNQILMHGLWGCRIELPLWKINWQFFYQFKYTHTIWSSNSTPKYLSKRNENVTIQRVVLKFRAALFILIIVKNWKGLKYPSTDEGINYQWYILTMKYCSAIAQMFSRGLC